jgi:hypothetical protein
MMSVKTALRTRFEEFIQNIQGVEIIDRLRMGQKDGDFKRADYFAENRSLVIELKTLETDTEWKIEKILEPYREREEFPIFFGGWELNKILKNLPDGDKINIRLSQAITTSVRAVFRKANKQIRFTKKRYDLPNSQGLLVILNEKIEVLSPETILFTLRKIASSLTEDNQFRYTDVSAILLISEAHVKEVSTGLPAYPILLLKLEADAFRYEHFVRNLEDRWAEFNRVPMIREDKATQSFEDLGFQTVSAFEKATRKEMPRHDAWAKYYQANPYFRRFSDEWLRWMFEIILAETGKGMLKGATKKQKDRAKFFWMEVFTHFMEEVRHRGIDLRYFTTHENHFNELEDEMRRRFPSDFV